MYDNSTHDLIYLFLDIFNPVVCGQSTPSTTQADKPKLTNLTIPPIEAVHCIVYIVRDICNSLVQGSRMISYISF